MTSSTWTLGQSVVSGFLRNTRPNRTTGEIVLAGGPRIQLDLTGNCAFDLAGKEIRFAAKLPPIEPEANLDLLSEVQYGATGTITLAHRMPARDHVSDFDTLAMAPLGLGEGEKSLLVEWFGPCGQVVIELYRPHVEMRVELPEIPLERWPWRPELKMNELPPNLFVGLQLRRQFLEDLGLDPDAPDGDPAIQVEGLDVEREDPHGLFTEGQFTEGMGVLRDGQDLRDGGQRMAAPVFPKAPALRLAREASPGTPLCTLFEPPIAVLPPDDLQEDMVEAALILTVARLAQHAIAIDLCPHATPRKALSWLADEVLFLDARGLGESGEGELLRFSHREVCDECLREREGKTGPAS